MSKTHQRNINKASKTMLKLAFLVLLITSSQIKALERTPSFKSLASRIPLQTTAAAKTLTNNTPVVKEAPKVATEGEKKETPKEAPKPATEAPKKSETPVVAPTKDANPIAVNIKDQQTVAPTKGANPVPVKLKEQPVVAPTKGASPIAVNIPKVYKTSTTTASTPVTTTSTTSTKTANGHSTTTTTTTQQTLTTKKLIKTSSAAIEPRSLKEAEIVREFNKTPVSPDVTCLRAKVAVKIAKEKVGQAEEIYNEAKKTGKNVDEAKKTYEKQRRFILELWKF